MKKISLTNFKGDLYGGLTCAISSLPSSLAYGLLAFSPLGPEFIGQGLQAGLFSAIIAGFFAALFGGTKGLISGPKAPSTIIFAVTLSQLVASKLFSNNPEELIVLAITSALLMLILAGFIQIFLGLFGIGRLIKFIPYPVVAGFMNGSGLLIMKSQIWNVTGIAKKESFIDFVRNLVQIQPLTVIVALVTILTMKYTSRITRKIPGSIMGLITGTVVFQIFIYAGFEQYLSSTIGAISIKAPTVQHFFYFGTLFQGKGFQEILKFVIPGALGVAILNSIGALLSSHVISDISKKRSNSNRELIGQGIGNIAAAIFGGISATGTLSRSLANYNAGGKTRLSGIATSVIMLLIVLSLSQVVAFIPKAAIAGLLFGLAYKAFDKQSLDIIHSLLKNETRLATHRNDLIIILAVTLVTVTIDLVAAVGLGIVISILIFIVKMSKTIIRRTYLGSAIHSNTTRNEELTELLIQNGNQIAVLELEGSLFFGSADILSNAIDRLADEGVKYFVLDLKRINDIDSTGSNILAQYYSHLKSRNKFLAISYVKHQGKIWHFLKQTTNLMELFQEQHFFPETDRALEYFENLLLQELAKTDLTNISIPLETFPFMKDLGQDDFKTLNKYLQKHEFKSGDMVFKQGESSTALYFLTSGSVNITINIDELGNRIRVAAIMPGTFFGEIALLDNTPRSANVEAREDLTTYVLLKEDFEILKQENSNISIALLTNISKTFAMRLRATNRMVLELEK